MKIGKLIITCLTVVFCCSALVTIFLFQVVHESCLSPHQKVRRQINELKYSLEVYHADCRRYPTTEESLRALRIQPKSCKDWGPVAYHEFPNAFLGCKAGDYINLMDQNHQYTYSSATLSLAMIFLGNCLSLQRIFSKETFYSPQDPWGHELVYKSDGKSYEIISLGKDGLPGGDNANVDVSSKEIE